MSLQQQKEYTQGFLDALRAVQTTKNFEFSGVSSPVLPQLTPTNFSPITPANPSDMQAIMMSILGTPISSSGTSVKLPQVDDISLLVSAAFPGPQLIQLSPTSLLLENNKNSTNCSTTTTTTTNSIGINQLPILNSPTSIASTSRPNKLKLTSPKVVSEPSESDSDSGQTERRSLSRTSRNDEMALDEQERKKLERKRARNRQAASKCRQKKMDRIKELEESVTQEKQKMARLDSEIHQLRSTLSSFQAMVQRHVSNGCQATSCRN